MEVRSAIGSNVSVRELRDELLITLTSLRLDDFSSQIAFFTSAINLASSSVNSSATPQISNSLCSMLIFQIVHFVVHKRLFCTLFDYIITFIIHTPFLEKEFRKQICLYPCYMLDNTHMVERNLKGNPAPPRILSSMPNNT